MRRGEDLLDLDPLHAPPVSRDCQEPIRTKCGFQWGYTSPAVGASRSFFALSFRRQGIVELTVGS